MDNYDIQVDMGKRIFLEYDQEVLIRKFRLEADERWIYLNYMTDKILHFETTFYLQGDLLERLKSRMEETT